MADNKVIRSIEAPGGQRCVDIFFRPDGSWGFEEYRRDPEEASGWYRIGAYAELTFRSAREAESRAQSMIEWLT